MTSHSNTELPSPLGGRARTHRALSGNTELRFPTGWEKIRSHLGTAGYNILVSGIPFHLLRQSYLRAMGMEIGSHCCLMRNTTIMSPHRIQVGNNTIIGAHCFLGGESGLRIGNNVNISSYTVMLGGHHDINDPTFASVMEPIEIEDYVWLATRSTIVGGVRVGRGAVVAAGAVVTKDVAPYSVVGGVPAKKIGERDPNACVYQFNYQPWFF